MGRTSQMALANRVMDGRLHDLFVAWRAEGLSSEGIARRLFTEYGISLSGETVRRWLKELELA